MNASNGGRGGGGGGGGGGDAGDPKRYYYQASALRIEHKDTIVNNKRCWRSVRDERSTEVWELLQVWFLYIEARINLINLSPQTEYAAYLIFKLKSDSKGLNGAYLDASVSLDNTLQENVVCLTPNAVAASANNLIRFPVERSDGWMEVELGQFYCDESTNREAVACLQKTTEREMSGLVVAGVDVRPT
ncbi:hypothetical protein LUZ61_014080 [Rhynchospora tenuis]|uniref:Uncharacterized protein n=1 Tax=Rhynchospora tenuis TaxID=198213 RepID=A0AAD5WAE5_9POAL|nr:hypothetical protein LUZ61_014080 [Rhynchospora tenuis]